MQGWVPLKLYYPADSLNHSTSVSCASSQTKTTRETISIHKGHLTHPRGFKGELQRGISKSSSLGRRQKNQTCFFFQPQEKDKSLHANLLCNCVSYDIFVIYYVYKYDVYISIYIYTYWSLVIYLIKQYLLPTTTPLQSSKILQSFHVFGCPSTPLKIFSGGSWWSKFPRLMGKKITGSLLLMLPKSGEKMQQLTTKGSFIPWSTRYG